MTTPANWQKSSFSGGGEGNDCVELASTWQKSSFSGGADSNNCIELATTPPTTLHLRESETPTTTLTTTPAALAALLQGIRSGKLATDPVER
ncbi:DUF397 domain-containing protein [Streptomyces sp. NPDC051576]|uniref:DUF397 domain-containing protein n=1 Tax=Streptomyces sp. NPDC051576 TaxID=3155803 RepID=UPI003415FFA7